MATICLSLNVLRCLAVDSEVSSWDRQSCEIQHREDSIHDGVMPWKRFLTHYLTYYPFVGGTTGLTGDSLTKGN